MSNIQKILLIRHGETEKDKSNPSRGLTEKGISQIRLVSKVIRPFISSNTQILSSDTNRAKQTAQIIGETLIVVGHEASLEAFLYNQKVFKLVCKSFKTYFDYGDWAYLIASKL